MHATSPRPAGALQAVRRRHRPSRLRLGHRQQQQLGRHHRQRPNSPCERGLRSPDGDCERQQGQHVGRQLPYRGRPLPRWRQRRRWAGGSIALISSNGEVAAGAPFTGGGVTSPWGLSMATTTYGWRIPAMGKVPAARTSSGSANSAVRTRANARPACAPVIPSRRPPATPAMPCSG